MKTILFVLTLTALAFAQHPYTNPVKFFPFPSGSDTLGSITNVDTVKWQVRSADLNNPGAWNTFSTYITAANKSSEQTVVLPLANESAWTYGEELRLQLASPAGTLTSGWMYIGNRLGALTVFVQPDTVTTPDSTVYKVRVQGQ